eukprot:403337453
MAFLSLKMNLNISILLLLLISFTQQTTLNQDAIANYDRIYPRCFDQNNSTVVFVDEEDALFSTKMRVFLAPKARCSFLAVGDVKLEWQTPDDPKAPPPIWNFVLNYTGTPCSLYGGDTLEEAMRNSSNGLWMRTGGKNCAFYVVVGNNDKTGQRAEFYFYRTNALLLTSSLISLLVGFIVITLSF